jgi:hypothetical protein
MAYYYNFTVQFFVKLLIRDTERGFFTKREREKEGDL